jgi:putative transposase
MPPVLSEANGGYERRYELRRRGYDLERIAERVAEIYAMEKDEVFSKGPQQGKVKARSLLAYWAVGELGMSHTDLARQLQMSVPGVGFAVHRGETIVRNNKYESLNKFLSYLAASPFMSPFILHYEKAL